MDRAEKHVREHLRDRGHKNIQHEPDGNVPPDFVVDGEYAVEVRRLNQNIEGGEGTKGLEEDDIPLLHKFRDVLSSFDKDSHRHTWMVFYRFNRPVPHLRTIEDELVSLLGSFLSRPERVRTEYTLPCGIDVTLYPAKGDYEDQFRLGGYSDLDSGGWLLAEMERNLRICIDEKTRSIASVKHRYPKWWLVLVDFIGFGFSERDRDLFHDKVRVEHDWDRVVIVDPRDPTSSIELPALQ